MNPVWLNNLSNGVRFRKNLAKSGKNLGLTHDLVFSTNRSHKRDTFKIISVFPITSTLLYGFRRQLGEVSNFNEHLRIPKCITLKSVCSKCIFSTETLMMSETTKIIEKIWTSVSVPFTYQSS